MPPLATQSIMDRTQHPNTRELLQSFTEEGKNKLCALFLRDGEDVGVDSDDLSLGHLAAG